MAFNKISLILLFILQAFFACLVAAQESLAQPDNNDVSNGGLSSFTRAGLPTIFFVGSIVILAYALYYSTAKAGSFANALANHPFWTICNLLLALFGLVLIFGPDSLTSNMLTSNSGGFFNSPRVATIGLQLCLQAAIGFFAIMTLNSYAAALYILFGIFNFLCLLGNLFFFNFNQPIWVVSSAQCMQYFRNTTLNRCSDGGFLQAIRVLGTLSIFLEGLVITASLLSWASAASPVEPQAGTASGFGLGLGSMFNPYVSRGTQLPQQTGTSTYAKPASSYDTGSHYDPTQTKSMSYEPASMPPSSSTAPHHPQQTAV